MYLDKHVRYYLTNIRPVGTVLHLRNVTKGLILYDNTFDKNLGTTGTNLLIE